MFSLYCVCLPPSNDFLYGSFRDFIPLFTLLTQYFIMSIIIRDLSYVHSDKEVLFQHLNLTVNPGDKMALTGNNGCGKSTLMRIIAGDLSPVAGTVTRPEHLYYVPQHFGQYDKIGRAHV